MNSEKAEQELAVKRQHMTMLSSRPDQKKMKKSIEKKERQIKNAS